MDCEPVKTIRITYFAIDCVTHSKSKGDTDSEGLIGHLTVSTSLLFQDFLSPLPKRQDSSELKEFADDDFRFDENGGKFSNRVENTAGKGEIAHYEQFLLVP